MKKSLLIFAMNMLAIMPLFAQFTTQIPLDEYGFPAPKETGNFQSIMGRKVVLKNYKLQPWISYDKLLQYSMNFLKYSPVKDTPEGPLPYYLITSKLYEDGSFMANQNNQAGNFYFAMETFKRYYAYTGDRAAFEPCRILLEHINQYLTPSDWQWAGMPRTQDDIADGVYVDARSEVDKMCMFAIGCIDYARFTGEKKYFEQAEAIARRVLKEVQPGDAEHSPLPFRVNMRTGKVLDPYCANWIFAVRMIDELLADNTSLDQNDLKTKKKMIMDWIMNYPLKNGYWSGYFEDVRSNHYTNVNQFSPLETARYMLNNVNDDPRYKEAALQLISFVRYRFGGTSRYGATSICEQDYCFIEMISHTARYASVVAKWFGLTQDERMHEEARASFALSTYPACNNHSNDSIAINSTGIGYEKVWYSDSYWDYMTHILDAFADMPDMIPEETDHLFYSSSMITNIEYGKEKIVYTALDNAGTERLKLTFTPKVYVDGKPLAASEWSFGKWRGVVHILTINHKGNRTIEIRRK